jgi:hypothetical protein
MWESEQFLAKSNCLIGHNNYLIGAGIVIFNT